MKQKEVVFMTEELKTQKEECVTRRGALAALGAVALGSTVAPKQAFAADDTPTRKDIAKVSFEIATYKSAADKFEREPNKSTVVDENSTDEQYPSALATYNFMKGKERYQHEVTDAGKSLFVGADGNTTLDTYTVDDKLDEYSANPVQGKVVYKAIKEIDDCLGLDEKPQKHETSGSEVSDDLKYVCKSNGYWVTYQQTQSCPANFSDCEMGVNYKHTSSGTITSDSQNWAVKRVDDSLVCLCEDEFGGMYLGNANTTTFTPPKTVWHS